MPCILAYVDDVISYVYYGEAKLIWKLEFFTVFF